MLTSSRMVAAVAACAAAAAMALAGTGPVAAEDGGSGGGQESTEEVPSRPLVISEFRVRGPNGANDEFIEITNVSATDHTVNGTSGTGYGLAASDGTTRCSIPDGTVVPAYGSYLCVNSVGYSLASYPAGNGTTATGDATYTADIPDNAGIALFNNNNAGPSYQLVNRLDAVGSTAEANPLYREGAGYPPLVPFSIDYSFYRNLSTASITDTTLTSGTPGIPEDTDDNASDFVFVDTNGTSAGAGQRLGAPGPANLSSPRSNGKLDVSLLDPCVSAGSPPNAVRDLTSDPANNSFFGTYDIRRTITNNTGGPVTRLRLRVADVRTFPAPSGISDMRPRTSTAVVVTVDRAPCGSGTSNTTVWGTTLEQPASQPNGGGFNSSMSVGTVTLASPLANGASVDVRLLTGVQQQGANSIRVIAEALTGGDDDSADAGTCLVGTNEGNMCVPNQQTDIVIPGSGTATPYPSTIDAQYPANAMVTDVNVGLTGLTHTYTDDLDILLVAPDGTTSSVVMSDVGNGAPGASNVNLRLDDEAASDLPDNSTLSDGTFRPTNAGLGDFFPAPAPATEENGSLANFNGVAADGTWSLYVNDDASGDVGSIGGWYLELTVTNARCAGVPATIVGTDAAQTINGTPGDDVIVAFGGDDTVNGGGGDDLICGGQGKDTIKDQAGKDESYGNSGDDQLVQTSAIDNQDTLHGGSGVDTVSYATRGSQVLLSLNGAADDGAAGENDRILATEDLAGGLVGDIIVGNSSNNELFGNGGNDELQDLGGADTVRGGAGNDKFVTTGAADNSDLYDGAGGTDTVTYASRAGNVNVSLNNAADDGAVGENDNLTAVENVTGGSGNDTINGSAGPNTLVGNDGNDTFRDFGGADNVSGGVGNDVFNQSATADAGDTLNGGVGADTVSYSGRTAALVLTLANNAFDDGAVGEGDRLIAMDHATSGSGPDTVTGTTGNNTLRGGGGDDSVKGLAGADQLFGEVGADDLDTVDGVSGNDTANGGSGSDTALTDPGDIKVSIP